MKQMIIKVDDDFISVPEGLALQTAGQLVGSKSWYNKILILCVSSLSAPELEAEFLALDLSWSVVAIEGESLSLPEFKNYMSDIIEFNEDGEEISSSLFSDLSTIQTFAGKRWTL